MMIWWDVYIVFLSYDVRLFKAEHMMDAIHMIGIPSGNLLQFAIEAMVHRNSQIVALPTY
jgi:hypothetical protein